MLKNGGIKKDGLKTGYTTGACSAAAARAAIRSFLLGKVLRDIEIELPTGRSASFKVDQCKIFSNRAIASVVKDAGDDPDCTHGARLVAEVMPLMEEGIHLAGGKGVATVTKDGLGLPIGAPSITSNPRANICKNVAYELKESSYCGAKVIIHVPDGEKIALQTINERLGLKGGISILGVTGIVKPFSTEAYKATIQKAIDVAKIDSKVLVFTTGGKTERYAMDLLPHYPSSSFIQVADYIGFGLHYGKKVSVSKIIIVAMIGKLAKIAEGNMMTHVRASSMNIPYLYDLAIECGYKEDICQSIKNANTARHVLDICEKAGDLKIVERICHEVKHQCEAYCKGKFPVECYCVDFSGNIIGKSEEMDE